MDYLNKKCFKCHKGYFVEKSIYDDWEGYITCSHCDTRIKRYKD